MSLNSESIPRPHPDALGTSVLMIGLRLAEDLVRTFALGASDDHVRMSHMCTMMRDSIPYESKVLAGQDAANNDIQCLPTGQTTKAMKKPA